MKKTATSSAHTADPWKMDFYDDYIVIYGSDNSRILDIYAAPSVAKDAEARSNAHLVVAAPDLLKSLNRAVKDLCFLQRCTKISRQETIDDCEAAIAKAEGRTFCP
jgi:hypothetical protein